MTTPRASVPQQSTCRNCGQQLTKETGWSEAVNCYCLRTPCIAAFFREVRGIAWVIDGALAWKQVH